MGSACLLGSSHISICAALQLWTPFGLCKRSIIAHTALQILCCLLVKAEQAASLQVICVHAHKLWRESLLLAPLAMLCLSCQACYAVLVPLGLLWHVFQTMTFPTIALLQACRNPLQRQSVHHSSSRWNDQEAPPECDSGCVPPVHA